MSKSLKIFLTLLCLTALICSPVLADTSEDEAWLLERINYIRTAPFSCAQDLGYDSEFLKQRSIFEETAFTPWQADEYLNALAVAENNSAQELPVPEPAHDFARTAQTGGVLSFFNYMPVRAACTIIIDNLFKKEIEENNPAHLLSQNYAFAGISIRGGVTENGQNGWFVTICLGSSILTSEVQVLNMINQVRAEPRAAGHYIETDLLPLMEENWGLLDVFANDYPPIFFNSDLNASARAGAFFMLHGDYPEPLAFTMTPVERMAYYGYEGLNATESMQITVLPKGDAVFAVNRFVSSLILDELAGYPEGAIVFGGEYQAAGVGISFVSGTDFDTGVACLDAGTDPPADTGVSRIYGIFFKDLDGNAVYSPEEGMANQSVQVYDETLNLVESTGTDNAGHFSVTLETNRNYIFRAETETVSAAGEVFVCADQFVKLICAP